MLRMRACHRDRMAPKDACKESSSLSAAERQAMDYRNYMMQHITSLRKTFAGFSDLDCLVIVGLEGALTDEQKSALSLHNPHQHRLDVVGFDWI